MELHRPSIVGVYRQTEAKLEATRNFIQESLVKGYITDSKSPYALGLFYRAKADGKLRPIMDYRTLNKWTIRDTYPLPLIKNILDHLQGKTLFTKFDIRWGFNNIRIKEEDRMEGGVQNSFWTLRTNRHVLWPEQTLLPPSVAP